MGDFLMGTIFVWPIGWAPRGFMPCNGQLLPISQNTALFSLLGTAFGGDGRTTFALPNLNGRVPLGMGNGFDLGEAAGSASVTLTAGNIPAHTHPATFTGTGGGGSTPLSVTVQASTGATGNTNTPSTTNKFLAASPGGPNGAQMWASSLSSPAIDLGGVTASGGGGGITGGTITVGPNATANAPISTLPPYLGLNFIICVEGIFPARN